MADVKMLGPLYTPPGEASLGAHKVGKLPALSPKDPLGITHGKVGKGPGSETRTQTHSKT